VKNPYRLKKSARPAHGILNSHERRFSPVEPYWVRFKGNQRQLGVVIGVRRTWAMLATGALYPSCMLEAV
jgi:hypothetical protein